MNTHLLSALCDARACISICIRQIDAGDLTNRSERIMMGALARLALAIVLEGPLVHLLRRELTCIVSTTAPRSDDLRVLVERLTQAREWAMHPETVPA